MLRTSGGSTACRRVPSGSTASAKGNASSRRRPAAAASRCASRRTAASSANAHRRRAPCRAPRSSHTESGPLTSTSVTPGVASSGSSGPAPCSSAATSRRSRRTPRRRRCRPTRPAPPRRGRPNPARRPAGAAPGRRGRCSCRHRHAHRPSSTPAATRSAGRGSRRGSSGGRGGPSAGSVPSSGAPTTAAASAGGTSPRRTTTPTGSSGSAPTAACAATSPGDVGSGPRRRRDRSAAGPRPARHSARRGRSSTTGAGGRGRVEHLQHRRRDRATGRSAASTGHPPQRGSPSSRVAGRAGRRPGAAPTTARRRPPGGIDLVAERIEGERAVVDLLDYDVRFGRGFLFAPPRPLRPETASATGAPDKTQVPNAAARPSSDARSRPIRRARPATPRWRAAPSGRVDQHRHSGTRRLARNQNPEVLRVGLDSGFEASRLAPE